MPRGGSTIFDETHKNMTRNQYRIGELELRSRPTNQNFHINVLLIFFFLCLKNIYKKIIIKTLYMFKLFNPYRDELK